MRTYCTEQGTLVSALWWPKWERNSKGDCICKYRVDSLCCPTDTNRTSQSNHVHTRVLSCVHVFVIPWTVAHQAPLSLGFSRQECRSDCHGPRDWTFISCVSSLQTDSLPLSYLGSQKQLYANWQKKKKNLNFFFVCVMTFPLAFPDDSWIDKLILGRNHRDVALGPSLESSSSVAWRQFLDLSEPDCLWIKRGQYFRVPMAMVAPIYLRIIVTIIIFTCRS